MDKILDTRLSIKGNWRNLGGSLLFEGWGEATSLKQPRELYYRRKKEEV